MPIRMRTIPTRTTRTRITRDADHAHADHMHADHAHTDHMHADHSHADYRHEPSYAAEEPIYAVPPQHGGYAGGQPPHAEEDYDDPPRRKRGSSLRHRRHPDRLRHARHRRRLWLPHLRHGAQLEAGAGHHRRQCAEQDRSRGRPEVRALAGSRRRRPGQRRAAGVARRAAGCLAGRPVGSARGVPVAGAAGAGHDRLHAAGRRPAVAARASRSGSAPSPSVRTAATASGQPSGNEAPARAAPPAARTATQPPPRATRDQPLSLDPNAAAPPNEPARAQPQQRALTPPAPRETAAPAAAPAPRVAAVPPSGGTWRLSRAGVVAAQRSRRTGVVSRRCRRNIRSSSRTSRSSGVPISAARASIYRAMVGRSNRARRPFQFCNGLKEPAGSASSSGTDGAIVCRNRKQRLDPRGSGG